MKGSTDSGSDTGSDWSYDTLKCTPRRLIVCLDGTDDEPDDDQTNLCRFFHMLKHTQAQIPYYQTGIGTPIKCRIGDESYCSGAKHLGGLTRMVDKAFATSLSEHIRNAYTFLMDHYQEGDKIYIFGFSRGAYAARALAGMIHKIGMLPPERRDLLETAYENYRKADDLQGWKSSLLFKRRYSIVEHVVIQFVGVWDTVSSVGIFPRHLPFTSYNTAVRYIRHAVSLDEHRSKFEPLLYRDEDFVAASDEIKEEKDAELQAGYTNHAGLTDLKEVWFAGGHCDVGGGAVPNNTRYSLARISLRWMIHECFRTDAGIQFISRKLRTVGLDPSDLNSFAKSPSGQSIPRNSALRSVLEDITHTNTHRNKNFRQLSEDEEELRDALSPLHDRLEEQKLWKLPEIMTGWRIQPGRLTGLPILVPHLEAGRVVTNQKKVDLLVHRSVKLRIEAGKSIRGDSRFKYLESYHPMVNFDIEPIWVD